MIIWDNFKLQNSNNTVTFSASNGISGLPSLSATSLNISGTATVTTISATNINTQSSGTVTLQGSTQLSQLTVNGISTFNNKINCKDIQQSTGTATFNQIQTTSLNVSGTTTLNNVNFSVSVNLPANSTINNKPILDMLGDSVYREGYLIIICTKSGSDKIHITNLCNTKKINTLTIQLSTKSGTTTYVDNVTLNVGEPGEVKTSNPTLSADDVVQMSINDTNVRLYDIGACPSIEVVHPEYYSQIKIGFYVDPNNTNRNNRYVYLPQTAQRGLVFGNMIYSIPHFLTDYRTYSYICRDDQWVSSDDTVDVLPVVDCINPNAVN